MSNPLEQHRFTFEGATGLLARHLVDDHGVPPKDVARWHNGMTQGHWVALDDLHKQAHAHESTRGEGVGNELREAAQRVTGYIRARALMSNTDPEVISDIAVMPAGTEKPLEFRLLTSDLEALVLHAHGVTSAEERTAWPDAGRPSGSEVVASKELERLRAASRQLDALYAAGVDNWEGYAEARANR